MHRQLAQYCVKFVRNFDTILFLKNKDVIILTSQITVQRKGCSKSIEFSSQKLDLAGSPVLEKAIGLSGKHEFTRVNTVELSDDF